MNDTEKYHKVYVDYIDISICDDVGYVVVVKYFCPQCKKETVTSVLMTRRDLFDGDTVCSFKEKCDKCGLMTEVILN